MNDSQQSHDAKRVPLQSEVEGLPAGKYIAMVETFDPRFVEGWVEGDEAQFPVRVSLCVNGLEVAGTWADEPSKHNTQRTVRGFRIVLKDIWGFCKRTDRVSVRIDGLPIPIAKKGTYKIPGRNGQKSLAELRELLNKDYVFSQVGRLQLSKKRDTKWQQTVLGLYQKVREVLQREYDYDPFLVYGSLLGLVREGGFIGHDIDFDSAYLSRHTDGPSAAAELRDIGLKLIDHGFDVECKRTALHIHDPKDARVRIDLFDIYFNSEGELSFPFGIAGTTKITRSMWGGIADAELAGQAVRIPTNAEQMVEHLYGKSWRTPIAGFNWRRSRTTRAKEGWTLPEYSEEVYWANFYAHTELSSGSSFFNFVIDRNDVPETVLDIGCGDGRDTFSFARAGRHAIGMDRSHVAVRHATKKAKQAGFEEKLVFVAGDVGDKRVLQDVFGEARKVSGGSPVLFYMRFFLHSIPEEVQDTLMRTLADTMQPGDMFAAEFRTDKDAKNLKIYGGHYRRYQNGTAFGEMLESQCGLTILHAEEGTGLSPYKDEDPVLYRVIARK